MPINSLDVKFKFSNNDINRFTLLFRKGDYTYEYMDEWEKFNRTSLPFYIFVVTKYERC